MLRIKSEDAVGRRLAYDTTYVGVDGASILLRRGHVLTMDDIEKLKNSGTYYVWVEGGEGEEGEICEWDITPYVASRVLGKNLSYSYSGQGSTRIVAERPGVLKVDAEEVTRFNSNRWVLLITRSNNRALGRGELAGVVEAVPFKMSRQDLMSLALRLLLYLDEFKLTRLGAVVTGTEIYEGRKRGAYLPVIRSKCERYGWELVYDEVAPDDEARIAAAVGRAIDAGAQAVVVTGGMSVDATDKTMDAIKQLGAEMIAYGMPMKPTTMSALAYLDGVPIFAVSAGGIYYREWNSIDAVLARVMAGERIDSMDIAAMGVGGLTEAFLERGH